MTIAADDKVAQMIHDDTHCLLGEGPLWHPARAQLFWFDILGRKLHTQGRHWSFDRFVSAAGWIDDDTLLIASHNALVRFDIATGATETLCPLETDTPATRSNDGRADPWGGFWIGTMGTQAQPGAGAIWRYYRGELRKLYAGMTIPNAICFAPGGDHACFTDTPSAKIMRQRLNPKDGWPSGDPEVWIDLSQTGLHPDGAVFDMAGNLWNAQWGAGRVACYGPDATLQASVEFPASQTTCPAFGGPDMTTLFCTSAAAGLSQDTLAAHPHNGCTFSMHTQSTGQAEHRVIL